MTFDELAKWLRTAEGISPLEAAVVEQTISDLSAAFAASEDPFERRVAICEQIGKALEPAWREILVRLRDAYEQSTLAEMIGEVQRAFARSANDGWAAWLQKLAEAILEFRPRYTLGLCAPAFPFEPEHMPLAANLRRAIRCMAEERWEEVDDVVAWLAEQKELAVPTRARLLAILAEIEMFRFSELKRAGTLLAKARRRSPKDSWILGTCGNHRQLLGERDRAEKYFRRAIEIAPNEVYSYVGMGDMHKGTGEYDEAEEWYRKAIINAGGQADGYDFLLALLAKNDFAGNRTEILHVLDQRNAIDPEGTYGAFLSLGDACKDARNADEARRWYEQAKSELRERPAAYVSLAELRQEEGDAAGAEALCKKAIETDPECPYGYFLLGSLYEDQRRWEETQRLYEKFPDRLHRWKLYARVQVARMQAKLGEFNVACSVLFDVLHEEVESGRETVYAQSALEDLAEEYYRDHSAPEKALQLFDRILDEVGATYRARYHNLVGNVYYYSANYPQAAEHYRLASQADPSSANYHHYRADACRERGDFDEAGDEIERAFTVDKDAARRDAELAELANTQGNRAFERSAFEEAIAHYERAVELAPHNAVYYANLGRAWEDWKVSGKRIAHLEEAQRWYQKVLDTGDPSQQKRVVLLERRMQLARAWGEQALDRIRFPRPIRVDLAEDLVPLAKGEPPTTLTQEMQRAVDGGLRQRLFHELGVTIPGIRFREKADLLPGTYVIAMNEIPIVSGGVLMGHRLFIGAQARLKEVDIAAKPAPGLFFPGTAAWIAEDDCARLGAVEDELWTPTQYLVRHLEAVIRRNAVDLVGHQEVVNLLRASSDPVSEAIRNTPSTVNALTTVCRALVAENVTIQPFTELCQTFKTLYDGHVRLRTIVERIRKIPPILQRLPGRAASHYLRCSELFEQEMCSSLRPQLQPSVLAIEFVRCQEALNAVRSVAPNGDSALVVADPVLRPFVQKLVELEFPGLPILSVSEMPDTANFAPAQVKMDLRPAPEVLATQAVSAAERPDPAPAAMTHEQPSVELFISRGFRDQWSPADDASLDDLLVSMQDELFDALGILVPPVQVNEIDDLAEAEFQIRIAGAEQVSLVGLFTRECLVNESVDRLRLLNLQGQEDPDNPLRGPACFIQENVANNVKICREASLKVWGPAGYVVLHLHARLARSAALFLTDEAAGHLLDSLAIDFPDLIDLALDRYSVSKISQILRHLLVEEVSVRDLRSILDALLGLVGTTDADFHRCIVLVPHAEPMCPDPQAREVSALPTSRLADYVRTCLTRYISHKYKGDSNALTAYLLHPAIERRVIEASSHSGDEADRLIATVTGHLSAGSIAPTTVVLTTFESRGPAWQMLRSAFPTLPVLCYQELVPDLSIDKIAQIEWKAAAESDFGDERRLLA